MSLNSENSPAPVDPPETAEDRKSSYGDIFKSSALVGGSQGIIILVGMLQTKCVAYLLGPEGVGLNGNFRSILNLFGRIFGFGIAGSSIRNIANSLNSESSDRTSVAVSSLKQMSWIAGCLGSIALLLLSKQMSIWTFGNDEYQWGIIAIAVMILIRILTDANSSIVQGHREIKKLAKVKIMSALAKACVAVSIFLLLGMKGIVIVIVVNGLVNLALMWNAASRIEVAKTTIAISERFRESKEILAIGITLMWAGILAAFVAWLTRSLITKQIDMDSVGIFQSSFRISGMFIGFVLTAMAADFYPRLSQTSDDHAEMNRLVNEQTEIGLLLTFPGLIATLAMAPVIIYVFYTPKFLPATTLLKWFVLGCVFRMISWPMSYILLAKGKKKLMVITDTMFQFVHIVLDWLGLKYFQLVGVSIAFAALYLLHVFLMLMIAGYVTGFCWNTGVIRLLSVVVPVAFLAFLGSVFLPSEASAIVGSIVTIVLGIFCIRGLVRRLGDQHKLSRTVKKLPLGLGARILSGI